jgi:hypothetical protein
MAEPAQRQQHAMGEATADAPPVDPTAIARAYRFYRAQRHARVEHRRAIRWARVRFWAVLGMLLLACAVIGVTVWGEIARIFGI